MFFSVYLLMTWKVYAGRIISCRNCVWTKAMFCVRISLTTTPVSTADRLISASAVAIPIVMCLEGVL